MAIVGAGFTGLWTAYYLLRADPTLRVVVLEREVAGFGASGRNGGWCSALFPASLTWLARRYGRPAAVAQYRAMQETVDEVGAVAAAEGIDCHWAKGGTVVAARTPVQLDRSRAEVDEARAFGFGEDDLALLGPDEARARLGATGVLGATYTPHCAAIHPARLVRGLARAVERLGATVHEHTAVTAVEPHLVTTDRGRVRADVVVRATEGYTPALPGHRRDVAPVYSLMVATEPLPPDVWAEVGLAAAGDVRRPPAPHRLRAAHRGRPAGLRRPRRAVPLRLVGAPGARPRAGDVRRPAPGAGGPAARRRGRRDHPLLGRAARASPGTGAPPSASTRRPGWRGPAATWATGSRRPTWPAGP